MSVANEHKQYKQTKNQWKRCRDAVGGEAAVHASGEIYLPKLGEETQTDYDKRLHRTPFFNATRRTVMGLKGMIFRKDPQVEAPAAFDAYSDDIDMAGTPTLTFAQKIVMEVLQVGRVGVLVDYPVADQLLGATVAQVEAAGVRPMLKMYKAESIINWKMGRVKNATVLTMVVLAEETELPGDTEFEVKSEMRYRVLDLFEGNYRQRLFKSDGKKDEQIGGDHYPLKQNAPMDFIPFEFIGPTCNGPDVEDPALIDLVDVNLHHYSVSADYEECCHKMIPTLFISGQVLDADTKIYLGGAVANMLSNPNAKAYFAEPASNFEALRKNLEDKRLQMAVLGARMLEVQRAGVESAETTAQHRKGEESLLSGMSRMISQGLTKTLIWFHEWAGIAGTVNYQLNRDFVPVGMNAQELAALVASWQAGAISSQTLFENLQQGEIISSDVSFEDEQARIESTGPTLPKAE